MLLGMTKLSKEAIARQRALKVYIQRGGKLDTICDIGLFGPYCIDRPPGPEGVVIIDPKINFGPIQKNISTPPGPSALLPS